MPNDYFTFKKFTIRQEKAVFKVGTDGVLLGACSELPETGRILDAGTGTGLIALMAAQRSSAEINGIEPDEDSFSQAVENVKKSPWGDRIQIMNVSLSEFSLTGDDKFDVILTNPPYFRDSVLNPDHRKAAARHTFSMSPGEILDSSLKLLKEGGNLQLILPYDEATLFIAEATGYGFFCNRLIKVRPNPEGKIIRLIMKFEKTKKKLHESFLTIETGVRHQFTEEYRGIMKDFYLKF